MLPSRLATRRWRRQKGGEAAILSAEANIALLKAQKVQAEHLAKELEVALAQAKRDLSFTLIRAPFDGVVGNRSVQVGDYVTAGKRLAAIVPLDKVYIDANVKETQLADIKAGRDGRGQRGRAGRRADEGHRRQHRSRIRLAVLVAAARERDGQLHEDRAARA